MILQTAMKVTRLHRQRKTVAEIARELRISVAEVNEAYRTLFMLSIDDEQEEAARSAAIVHPDPAAIEAARESMPKKMAERQRKAEIDAPKR